MPQQTWIAFDGVTLHTVAKDRCILKFPGGIHCWIPRDQMRAEQDMIKGRVGTVLLTERIVDAKRLRKPPDHERTPKATPIGHITEKEPRVQDYFDITSVQAPMAGALKIIWFRCAAQWIRQHRSLIDPMTYESIRANWSKIEPEQQKHAAFLKIYIVELLERDALKSVT